MASKKMIRIRLKAYDHQLIDKRLIDIMSPTQKTVEALTALELPAGVEIEIKL